MPNKTALLNAIISFLSVLLIGSTAGCSKQDNDSNINAPGVNRSRPMPRQGAKKILRLAFETARGIDPDIRLRSMELNGGNRDLQFDSAVFVFLSPKLRTENKGSTSIELRFDNARITSIEETSYEWIEKAKLRVSPGDAFSAALDAGLQGLWERYKNVQLFMELKPYEEGDRFKPPMSKWVWQIMGLGPGVTVVSIVYLDGETLMILGTKQKSVLSLAN